MSDFTEFINEELPKRAVTLKDAEAIGNPNDSTSPKVNSSPIGTWYLQSDSSNKLWQKKGSGSDTWEVVGFTGFSGGYYDIAGSLIGKPTENQIILRFITPRFFKIPINFNDSEFKCGDAPLETTKLECFHNGEHIGDIVFYAGSNIGVGVKSSDTFYQIGDILDVKAISPQDPTFGNLILTIVGEIIESC